MMIGKSERPRERERERERNIAVEDKEFSVNGSSCGMVVVLVTTYSKLFLMKSMVMISFSKINDFEKNYLW